MTSSLLILLTYKVFGVSAILAGGLVSAFLAKRSSRLAMWVSAYLVIVVGLLQLLIGVSLHYITQDPATWLVILSFAAYNFGNAAVIVGTAYKARPGYQPLVNFGGGLLAVAMLVLLGLTWGTELSWSLALFYIAVVTILVTMPTGLILSSRRRVVAETNK